MCYCLHISHWFVYLRGLFNLHHRFSKLSKSPAIQNRVYRRIHKYHSRRQIPFGFPLSMYCPVQSHKNNVRKITYNETDVKHERINSAFYQTKHVCYLHNLRFLLLASERESVCRDVERFRTFLCKDMCR